MNLYDSLRSLERRRKSWGLLNTRQQGQTFTTIAPFIDEVKERFPNKGARGLVTHLRQEYLLKVSEYVFFFSLSGLCKTEIRITEKLWLCISSSQNPKRLHFGSVKASNVNVSGLLVLWTLGRAISTIKGSDLVCGCISDLIHIVVVLSG